MSLPLLAEPGARFADEAELAGYARRVHVHFGIDADGINGSEPAVTTWRSGARQGTCLLQGLNLAELRNSAAKHGVQLLGLLPFWSRALALACDEWPQLRRGAKRLLVVEGRVLTAISLSNARVIELRTHWLARVDGSSLANWAAEHGGGEWAAVGYSTSIAAVVSATPLCRIDADASQALARSAHAPQAPDFLAAAPRRPARLGWAAAATAACVLGIAAVNAGQAYSLRADAIAADAAAALEKTRGTHPRNEPSAAERAALARLAHPWSQVIAAAESTVPRNGAWTGLEHEAAQPTLHLSGVAASLPDALATASALGRAPGVADVLLSRSESVAGRGVEFELVGSLAIERAR